MNEENTLSKVSKELVESYIKQSDWRVSENANMAYSIQGLNNYVKEEISKYYWMNHIYSKDVAEAHINGRFHLHDSGSLSGYCMGLDLEDLLESGFYGGPGKVKSLPPTHFGAALGQLVNLMYSSSGEFAGACAVSNLDTLLAPFIYYDKLTKEQVMQHMQDFIFNMNVPTRVGYQSPFSNCTLDFTVPKHMANKQVLIGGKRMDKTYKEFQKEMDIFNECFFEVMNHGDGEGRIFSFPIPTINITKDFEWDNARYDAMWKNTAKYGQPYFCNYISSDMDPADAMSMCPLPGYTKVLVRTGEDNKTKSISLQELKQTLDKNNKDTVEILDDKGCFVLGKLVTIDPTAIYHFKLQNGLTVDLGENHLQPVLNKGTVKAKDIKVGDWLPFVKSNFDKISKEDEKYNYHQVVDITINENKDPLYCIELDTPSHLFQLDGGLVTHNCRLRIDLTELKRKGGLFGANPLTGSVSVCTINFPRLGYLHKNDESGFFKELDEVLELAKQALETRRAKVEEWTEQGLYPIMKFYLRRTKARFNKYWQNHFSTIATLGLNECLLNMFGYGVGDPKGRDFVLKVMNYLRDKAVAFQTETGHQYNIESSPAESTSFRLAKIDKRLYPDIIVADNETVLKEGAAPFYTNSTQLPVNYTDDIFELMDNQADINALYTGGSVQHIYLGERVKDIAAMKQLVKVLFSNYKIPYISITPTFSVCPVHGYLVGEHNYCPHCKSEEIQKINIEQERLKALLDR